MLTRLQTRRAARAAHARWFNSMKFTYDDRPADDGQSDAYAPKALPGFEDVATPIQGLLWADIGGPGKRERKPVKTEGKGPTLF